MCKCNRDDHKKPPLTGHKLSNRGPNETAYQLIINIVVRLKRELLKRPAHTHDICHRKYMLSEHTRT